ncbi:asparagine synthase-related protein [Nocardia sp. NPDC051570]|uniref:asparagine synthase-related protein n=1 Tax=Nocardia sp. NPDC051570 TaxID=3364324 RepID=UPI0037B3E04D
MVDEVWFAILPDCESALIAARLVRPWSSQVIAHPSGRPWLLGSWPRGYVKVGAARARRMAVIGRCPVTADALSARLERVRDVGDVESAARGLAGSFHLVASVDGRVRMRGSASGVRRVFYTLVGDVTIAANRADRLALMVGASVDERLLAVYLLDSPPPYPLDDRSPWRSVRAVRSHDCLLIGADGRPRTQRWWECPEPELTMAEGAPSVNKALTTAVDSCVADGGTVSADLSGGMDSTSLCFLAARTQDQGRAELVTLRWESLDHENDDVAWAERATAHLPDIEHVVCARDEWPLWYSDVTCLRDMATDEPGGWVRDSARNKLLARMMTGCGSRLHMTGGGGDELFTAPAQYLHDLLRDRPFAALKRIRRQRALQHWPMWPMLRQLADQSSFSEWMKTWSDNLSDLQTMSAASGRYVPSLTWNVGLPMPSWATPDAVQTVQSLLREELDATEPLASQRAQHATLSTVQISGRSVRQLSQVFSPMGLEYCAPYLDDGVIEAALAIRLTERIIPGRYKPVLAAAMRGTMPEPLLTRTTKGEYSADVYIGLRRNRAALINLFDDSRLVRAGLIDAKAVRASLLGLDPTLDVPRRLDSTLGSEVWLRARAQRREPSCTTIIEGMP